MRTLSAGYGMGSQSCAYQSLAWTVLRIFVVRTSGASPAGVGIGSGISPMRRSEGFHAEPSNLSSATMRMYSSWVSSTFVL